MQKNKKCRRIRYAQCSAAMDSTGFVESTKTFILIREGTVSLRNVNSLLEAFQLSTRLLTS